MSSADNTKLHFEIISRDFLRAGDAASTIKRYLSQNGFDPELVRRAAVAAYEAEMNIVIHSLGGMLTAQVEPDLILDNSCRYRARDTRHTVGNDRGLVDRGRRGEADGLRSRHGTAEYAEVLRQVRDHFKPRYRHDGEDDLEQAQVVYF